MFQNPANHDSWFRRSAARLQKPETDFECNNEIVPVILFSLSKLFVLRHTRSRSHSHTCTLPLTCTLPHIPFTMQAFTLLSFCILIAMVAPGEAGLMDVFRGANTLLRSTENTAAGMATSASSRLTQSLGTDVGKLPSLATPSLPKFASASRLEGGNGASKLATRISSKLPTFQRLRGFRAAQQEAAARLPPKPMQPPSPRAVKREIAQQAAALKKQKSAAAKADRDHFIWAAKQAEKEMKYRAQVKAGLAKQGRK